MPSQKKRPVTLTAQAREDLERITTTGVHGASQIMRARVLLALDTSVGVVDPEEVIAARLEVSRETLRLVAKRFADTGGDAHAIPDQGLVVAHLIAEAGVPRHAHHLPLREGELRAHGARARWWGTCPPTRRPPP